MPRTLPNMPGAPRPGFRLLAPLAAAACLVCAAGCHRTVNRAAERRVRDALPRVIGPARVWRAHVDNPAERTLQGRLRTVSIEGEEVSLRGIVLLHLLRIEMRGVVVDVPANRLRTVEEASFRAVIREDAVNAYFRENPPPPDEPVHVRRVRLRPGSIHVEAARWLLGRPWPFTATVEPRVAGPTRLEFDPERMSVAGLPVPLPAGALRWLARLLSDGLDLSVLPIPVRIRRVQVDAGRITLEGEADVARLLAEQAAALMKASGPPARLPDAAAPSPSDPEPLRRPAWGL